MRKIPILLNKLDTSESEITVLVQQHTHTICFLHVWGGGLKWMDRNSVDLGGIGAAASDGASLADKKTKYSAELL